MSVKKKKTKIYTQMLEIILFIQYLFNKLKYYIMLGKYYQLIKNEQQILIRIV